MRNIVRRNNFISKLGIQTDHAVFPQQVHGSAVYCVKAKDFGSTIANNDGLVYKNHGGKNAMILGVHTADCVPILAIDSKVNIIGTAHAGWKGTLGTIARELIIAMKKLGADVNNIYVSIGPHIGMCCYNIMDDRARVFQKQFGINEKITGRIQGEWHLDIGYANYQTLLESGVAGDHIDASVTCTSCQVKEFYSYRKDTKETFGEQIGFIGFV
jgi:YfiH family protein